MNFGFKEGRRGLIRILRIIIEIAAPVFLILLYNECGWSSDYSPFCRYTQQASLIFFVLFTLVCIWEAKIGSVSPGDDIFKQKSKKLLPYRIVLFGVALLLFPFSQFLFGIATFVVGAIYLVFLVLMR